MNILQNKSALLFLFSNESTFDRIPRVGADPCVCPNNKGIASREIYQKLISKSIKIIYPLRYESGRSTSRRVAFVVYRRKKAERATEGLGEEVCPYHSNRQYQRFTLRMAKGVVEAGKNGWIKGGGFQY